VLPSKILPASSRANFVVKREDLRLQRTTELKTQHRKTAHDFKVDKTNAESLRDNRELSRVPRCRETPSFLFKMSVPKRFPTRSSGARMPSPQGFLRAFRPLEPSRYPEFSFSKNPHAADFYKRACSISAHGTIHPDSRI